MLAKWKGKNNEQISIFIFTIVLLYFECSSTEDHLNYDISYEMKGLNDHEYGIMTSISFLLCLSKQRKKEIKMILNFSIWSDFVSCSTFIKMNLDVFFLLLHFIANNLWCYHFTNNDNNSEELLIDINFLKMSSISSTSSFCKLFVPIINSFFLFSFIIGSIELWKDFFSYTLETDNCFFNNNIIIFVT